MFFKRDDVCCPKIKEPPPPTCPDIPPPSNVECPTLCGTNNSFIGFAGTSWGCFGTTPANTPYNAVINYDKSQCPEGGCCIVDADRAEQLCRETPGCIGYSVTNNQAWNESYGHTNPDGSNNPNAPLTKKATLLKTPVCPMVPNPDWETKWI